MERDGEYWLSSVRDRRDGSTYQVRSKFVIGADGARASVLNLLGPDVDGQAGLLHAANIWFEADLSWYFEHRPGVVSWNVHPGPQPPLGLGTIICHDPFREFVLVRFFDPEKEDLAQMTDEEALAHMERAVGEPVEDVEILGIAGWQVNDQVASTYGGEQIVWWASRYFTLRPGDIIMCGTAAKGTEKFLEHTTTSTSRQSHRSLTSRSRASAGSATASPTRLAKSADVVFPGFPRAHAVPASAAGPIRSRARTRASLSARSSVKLA